MKIKNNNNNKSIENSTMKMPSLLKYYQYKDDEDRQTLIVQFNNVQRRRLRCV